MEFTGKLLDLMIDLFSRKQKIVLTVNEDARQAFEELKDCDLVDIVIKKHRKKRSLDANAYYWVLVTKLAKVLNSSKPEIHNHLLRMYGEPELFDGKAVYTTIPDTEEAEKKVNTSMYYHLAPTSQIRQGNDGVVYRNGTALDEPYTKTLTTLREGSDFPQVVEEGNVFVMGDNRNNSKDSRSTQIGQVDKREVLGKVIFLMYPGTGMKGDQARDFDRIGAIA